MHKVYFADNGHPAINSYIELTCQQTSAFLALMELTMCTCTCLYIYVYIYVYIHVHVVHVYTCIYILCIHYSSLSIWLLHVYRAKAHDVMMMYPSDRLHEGPPVHIERYRRLEKFCWLLKIFVAYVFYCSRFFQSVARLASGHEFFIWWQYCIAGYFRGVLS